MLRLQDLKITRPLSIRDFALLWTAMTVSMLGDGIYLVALAWQVYRLSNVPTAMSLVGVAWTAPMLIFLLIGGVVSDRFDRRHVMIASDVVRGVAVCALGLLSVAGVLELWHVFVLVAIYGVGESFFGPAFGAIVPDLIPQDMLLEANSINQFVRPFAMRLAGPALGGLLIAALGGDPGMAFVADAGTFAFSAGALMLMTKQRVERSAELSARAMWTEVREGFAFVRSQTWLWATLASAAITLLVFWGPYEVLLPFVVKNRLGGGADDLGLIFAVGGLGSVLASLLMAQRGLPRRHILFMYLAWSTGIGSVAAYALVTTVWQAMLVSFFEGAAVACGLVVWGTLMHRLVPTHLQGRVNSIDWLVSIAFVPLSFALTGPLAEWVGVETTLLAAGLLGASATLAFLLIPGLYDTESDGRLDEPEDGSRPREQEELVAR